MTMATIGTIAIEAGERQRSYETAAWYRTFEYDAQTCDVTTDGRWVFYKIQGRDTYEHFPSLFAGVATGGGRIGEIDEASTFVVQLYDYIAADMVEQGIIELAEGFKIEESYFDHPVSCSGYVTDHSAPIGQRYSPCECEVHEDAHFQPTRTDRNDRGFLSFGYKPGVKNTKRHIKIVEDN